MKFFKLHEVLLYIAVFVATFWSASAFAQVIITPQEGEIVPDALPVSVQPRKTTANAVATDAKPGKRNPFWPIDIKLQERKIPTTNDIIVPPPPEAKKVDWNKAVKFVKENRKLSNIAGKIHLAFNGRIYEIDSLMDVPFDGNIYTFKVMDRGELEQHGVRPE